MSLIFRFTLLSRVLALVREQAFAALVGAGYGIHADAFRVAFKIPNLLRDLFAEGALSAAFVPTYARAMAEGGPEEARRLVRQVMSLLLVVVSVVVAAGILTAPWIVRLLAGGFAANAGKVALTVSLTRIMMPFLLLVSLAATAMGVLNAQERYGPPAMAPAMFNVLVLLAGAFLWWRGYPPETVVYGWAVGTLLGGTAQLVVQWPALWRLGLRPRLDWAPFDPRIREIVRLMGPATLGLAAMQINILVGTRLASLEQGGVAWLEYAFRILYLPIGLFGVALGTITAARTAHRASAGDLAGLRQSVGHSLRMLAFLTIPATVGLVVLAVPIVRLLFEHGRCRPSDTEATAGALVLYAFGLVAYTSVKVLAPAFYSMNAPRVPLVGSVAAVAAGVSCMYAVHGGLGFMAVALGTSVGAFVNAGVLLGAMQRRMGDLWEPGLKGALLRMALAALLMGAAAHVCHAGLERWVGHGGFPGQLSTGLVPVCVGVVVYFALGLLMRIPEARDLLSLAWRRPREGWRAGA